MSMLILGADGYLGWSLTCLLALTSPDSILAVDDLSKRRRVAECGYESAIPIPTFAERGEILRRCTARADIACIESPVVDCVEELIRTHRPHTIVHLAQIPSAPFSMMSFAHARETLENNETSNLAVLFAMRDYAPDAHLVKMGSMGEYAPCGVPMAEGYVHAVLDGHEATRLVPFPREASDVYHITKINDTNFVSMACRVWGLSVTDVMQSIVYGIGTHLSDADPRLATRFDCDPIFGSVVNRFVAQAISGVPLTVHGTGSATTGLIYLRDTATALAHWIAHRAAPAQHRVINQANETRVSILHLAQLVQWIGRERGLDVELSFEHDPRHEAESPLFTGAPRNDTIRNAGVLSMPLEEGIRALLANVAMYGSDLRGAASAPNVDWRKGTSSSNAVPRGESEAQAAVSA